MIKNRASLKAKVSNLANITNIPNKYLIQNFENIEFLKTEKNPEIENLLNNNKYTSQIEGKIEYTENIEDAKKFKSSKSAENYIEKHWGLAKNKDTYSVSRIL